MNCIFCEIIEGNSEEAYVVYEDNETIAFLDKYPIDRGHTLVIPKPTTRTFSTSQKKHY